MIVLGIDPGYSRFGWAVVKAQKTLELVDFDCLNLEKEKTEEKLLKIGNFLEKLIVRHKPDYVVLEKVFFSKNVKTAIKVAQVAGIVFLKAGEKKIKVIEVSPNEVKKFLTGFGFSDKAGIKKTLEMIFELDETKKIDDAYDALALAVVGADMIKLTSKK